ncbi:hypothetical protein MCHI_002232 [Candidatus Magnetoovum chiemensis]|nr:hypothetical protein MCHI_002232 [Candidatus Magnetoovum chiemensis]
MFLIAHLTIEELSNKSLDWLRDKHTNAYFKIVDFLSPNYSTDQDKIYELYKIAYEETARIEGHGLLLDDKNKLIDYNKWVIITDSNVYKACALIKDHKHGLKLCIIGNDGTLEGKGIAVCFSRSALNINGVFGEFSGKIEQRLIDYVPKVKVGYAAKILEGKVVEKLDDYYYQRDIGDIKNMRKIMLGKPNVI